MIVGVPRHHMPGAADIDIFGVRHEFEELARRQGALPGWLRPQGR